MASKRRRNISISSESDEDEEEFNHKYDENLYEVGNKDDVKYIQSLEQTERTLLLYERNEERELAKTVWETDQAERKKKKKKEKPTSKSKSRSKKPKKPDSDDDSDEEDVEEEEAEDPDAEEDEVEADEEDEDDVDSDVEDDVGRGRPRRNNKKKEALSRLRAKRNKNKAHRDSLYDEASDDDGDDEDKRGESDGYDEDEGRRSPGADDDDDDEEEEEDKSKAGEMEDIERIKLSRFRLEKWCHEDFFDEVVKGCFVRVGIGPDNMGHKQYRLTQIGGVEMRTSAYTFDKTKTRKSVLLQHGSDSRLWRMSFISNGPITEKEFRKWKEAMEDSNMHIPTTKQIQAKFDAIEEHKNHIHTNMHTLKKVIDAKKEALGENHGNSAFQKSAIMKKITQAQITLVDEEAQGNEELISVIKDQIEKYKQDIENITQTSEERYKDRTVQFSGIASVNKRNEKADREKAVYMQRENEAKAKTAEGRVLAAKKWAGVKADLFVRRRNAPSIVSMRVKTDKEKEKEKEEQEAKDAKRKDALEELEKAAAADDVGLADMELDIDVDIHDDFADSKMSDSVTKAEDALHKYKLENGLL